jgi:hypothetical protein
MVTNPYQAVIDWLRSPEGEAWSEGRMRPVGVLGYVIQNSVIRNSAAMGPAYLKGVFNIKEQNG